MSGRVFVHNEPMQGIYGIILLAALLLAAPIEAVNCRQWDRMGPGQKAGTVDRMIQGAVSGSGGRQYHVDRGAIARCLERYARSIAYDFDGACADARTASSRELNRIFKNYIWTCAN